MFPALVGMNRFTGLHTALMRHVPRTRGDEPPALGYKQNC